MILIKPVYQTPRNVPSAMQRLHTDNIDSADVSHAALIILLDILSSPEALLVGNALTIFMPHGYVLFLFTYVFLSVFHKAT
jgi:hypothetical protein